MVKFPSDSIVGNTVKKIHQQVLSLQFGGFEELDCANDFGKPKKIDQICGRIPYRYHSWQYCYENPLVIL